ncbi:hypothetical protein G9A89_005049 [Geosiphon pyriformis]|nr:hypothetical protein G9A89_005049 [Geosiphon pyriformis]
MPRVVLMSLEEVPKGILHSATDRKEEKTEATLEDCAILKVVKKILLSMATLTAAETRN